MKYLIVFVILISVLSIDLVASVSPVCKSNSGRNVDWWIAYKIPSIKGNEDPIIEKGLGFVYMDNLDPVFKQFGKSMNDSSSTFISNTLNQIYSKTSNGHLMWNDQPPIGTDSSSRAHAKGVFGFDEKGGFFIRHSIPRFPHPDVYSYPNSGVIYGQTLMCITVDITNLNTIAAQFQINYPNIYSADLPPKLQAPNITNLSNQISNRDDNFSVQAVTLKSGMVVTDFAKSRGWDNDLWENLVAPTLRTDMYVETWGRPIQPNACKPAYPQNVKNVNEIFLAEGIEFTETKDHSKWGVSTSVNSPYTCIGDINRMTSQRKRGGGATCIKNQNIHSQFQKIIEKFEVC